VLDLLDDLAQNDKEKYATFWKTFGSVLKEGFVDDMANRDRLAKLARLRFDQGGTDAQDVSLGRVCRAHEGRPAGDLLRHRRYLRGAANSPHLEFFRKKDVEVLILYDRIDEWVAGTVPEFEGKPLRSVAKGALDLGELADAEEKKAQRKKPRR
jgi:molecular chaperone HtpG